MEIFKYTTGTDKTNKEFSGLGITIGFGARTALFVKDYNFRDKRDHLIPILTNSKIENGNVIMGKHFNPIINKNTDYHMIWLKKGSHKAEIRRVFRIGKVSEKYQILPSNEEAQPIIINDDDFIIDVNDVRLRDETCYLANASIVIDKKRRMRLEEALIVTTCRTIFVLCNYDQRDHILILKKCPQNGAQLTFDEIIIPIAGKITIKQGVKQRLLINKVKELVDDTYIDRLIEKYAAIHAQDMLLNIQKAREEDHFYMNPNQLTMLPAASFDEEQRIKQQGDDTAQALAQMNANKNNNTKQYTSDHEIIISESDEQSDPILTTLKNMSDDEIGELKKTELLKYTSHLRLKPKNKKNKTLIECLIQFKHII